MTIRRDWTHAINKLADEDGHCRVCKSRNMVQQAHVIGREYDRYEPMRWLWTPGWKEWTVSPDRIVPLCKHCHDQYDEHHLDLLPFLTEWEVHQAIADCARTGRSNGAAQALNRIAGELVAA